MDSTLRFIAPQQNHIEDAKKELLNHKKETCWMWFMFPQILGLGDSYMSKYYGLKGIKETKTFYKNEYLKNNLCELTNIVLSYDNDNIEEVFGNIDAIKLQSSMTLFYIATGNDLFKKVLIKFYGGKMDNNTIELLKNK